MLIAAVTAAAAGWLPVIIGLAGLSGCIFTALRWRRDDTTAVINQQDALFNEMKTLNEELRVTSTGLREERDGLRVQVEELTIQVKQLRDATGTT